MRWIVIVISFIIVSILLFILRAVKGTKYSIEDLRRAIKILLRQGYSDGFLIIEVCHSQHPLGFRSKYVLEFRKVIHAPRNYGTRLCFSEKKAKWPHVNIQKLQEFCDKREIRYSITKEEKNEPHELFSIDCGPDHNQAYNICKKILLELFALKEDAKFFIQFGNCTISDRLIDR